VSTEKEEQEHSLEAQTDYFETYIKENPRWEFVGLYVDDGISGLSYHNRDGFNRMVADAIDGKIDLIITKSLSRFARNTVDALMTIRKLKSEGVGVFFQKEDINTLDSKGEFMLTLMSSFAEEESRSISDNITWGKRKQFADGIYNAPFGQFLGYDRGFVINEKEARVVRFIYMLSLEYYSPSNIARLLMDFNIPSPSGKKVWQISTVKSILTNERYKGDALLQKTFTVDFRTKKCKVNEGELPQYYVTGGHAPIISPETWNEVQKISLPEGQRLSRRYTMSGKLVCGECRGRYGMMLWHSTTYRNYVWECLPKKQGKSKCHCTHIYAEEMESAIATALQHLCEKHRRIKKLCTELLSSVPLNDREGALMALADMKPQNITFDNSAVNVLITEAVVTTDAHIVFRFIDGSTYKYRICGNTPLGQTNMNLRKEYHRRIAELYAQGVPQSTIAETLGIPINTVRSYIKRSLK
jgi:DNA invertase Pin-like site-specific DNA recombinase